MFFYIMREIESINLAKRLLKVAQGVNGLNSLIGMMGLYEAGFKENLTSLNRLLQPEYIVYGEYIGFALLTLKDANIATTDNFIRLTECASCWSDTIIGKMILYPPASAFTPVFLEHLARNHYVLTSNSTLKTLFNHGLLTQPLFTLLTQPEHRSYAREIQKGVAVLTESKQLTEVNFIHLMKILPIVSLLIKANILTIENIHKIFMHSEFLNIIQGSFKAVTVLDQEIFDGILSAIIEERNKIIKSTLNLSRGSIFATPSGMDPALLLPVIAPEIISFLPH
jgi:hypothetical protein